MRCRSWALATASLVALVSIAIGAPLSGTSLGACRIVLSNDVDAPAHQVVQPGEQLEATYTTRAVNGDWTVDTNVAAEHGRIQGQATDVELSEGEEREVAVRLSIGDVPEGTYSIGIFSSATCTSGDGDERTTYGFEVTVASTPPGDVKDPQDDHVAKADGRSAEGADAVDLTRAEATLDGATVRFRLSVADAVPSLDKGVPLQIGCYLDTFGSATLVEPFDARGFERFARVSWHSAEATTRVTDSRREPTSDRLNVQLSDERSVVKMAISGLNMSEADAWLCFAETDTGETALLDVVPNHGGPYRGWLSN